MIFTHTHTDHWGGARGVLDDASCSGRRADHRAELSSWSTQSPRTSSRGRRCCAARSTQFGPFLDKGVRGHVDCGLERTMAAGGVALLRPTDLIIATGDTRIIDGVEFEC